VVWRVERALGASRREVAQKEMLGVDVRTLGASAQSRLRGDDRAGGLQERCCIFRGASIWLDRQGFMPIRPTARSITSTAWEWICRPLPWGRWRWEC
jgi:hypothetical protein